MKNFQDLALQPELATALAQGGFSTPTPIQAQAIPLALSGHDIMGLAQTGTGKTLAFGVPIIQAALNMPGRPAPRTAKALVLAPTRELVNQIAFTLKSLTKNMKLHVTIVVGGASIGKQLNVLSRGTDILVATPGRLIDLLERKGVDLGQTKQLVLDEADQMLDIGFIHALRKIVPYLNNDRQTQLFSATMSKQMENLSRVYLTNPQKIQVTPPGATADQITQTVRFVEKPGKPGMLRDILNAHRDVSALVFARTKHGAEKLKNGLVADGYAAESVHGNKSQGQRDRALKHFRAGDMKVLVATDVAARGIDIPSVGLVVNYDLPDVPENYVHRIGRTARAGRSGVAVTLCAGEEAKLLRAIEKLIKIRIQPEGDSPKFAPPAPADAKQGKPKRHKPRGNPNTGEHKPQRPNAQKTRRPKRRKPNKAA